MPGKYKSEEIRKLIVEAKQWGKLEKDIIARFHVSDRTVRNIWKRWKEARTVKVKKESGKPRKTTPRQEESVEGISATKMSLSKLSKKNGTAFQWIPSKGLLSRCLVE